MASRNGSNTSSPFTSIRGFTREESERLNDVLNRQLGPEYISKRPSGGGPVSYIEGWKALNLANHVFGFNGWNSEIKNTSVDYVDDHGGNGRYSVGLSVIVRITLKDGTYHEDIGYGSIDNANGRAIAFEKCKKQAITDGMKRCLRCFGNVLGNCLYDKDFLKYVWKIKTPPPAFKETDLLRHPDIVKKNKLKDVEANDFSVSKVTQQQQQQQHQHQQHQHLPRPQQPLQRMKNEQGANVKTSKMHRGITSGGSAKSEGFTESMFDDSLDDMLEDNLDSENEFNDIDDYELALMEADGDTVPSHKLKPPTPSPFYNTDDSKISNNSKANNATISTPANHNNSSISNNNNNNNNNTNISGSQPLVIPSSVTFFSAKAASEVQLNSVVPISKKFNVNYQSPSLKRTTDQTKSTPIKRTGIQQQPIYRSSAAVTKNGNGNGSANGSGGSSSSSGNNSKRHSVTSLQDRESFNKQRRLMSNQNIG